MLHSVYISGNSESERGIPDGILETGNTFHFPDRIRHTLFLVVEHEPRRIVVAQNKVHWDTIGWCVHTRVLCAIGIYQHPQHNALVIPVLSVIENEHVSLKTEERLRVFVVETNDKSAFLFSSGQMG